MIDVRFVSLELNLKWAFPKSFRVKEIQNDKAKPHIPEVCRRELHSRFIGEVSLDFSEWKHRQRSTNS